MTAKKVITFQRAMTKKGRQFFSRKNRVTPSRGAPVDTNTSDATVYRTDSGGMQRECVR